MSEPIACSLGAEGQDERRDEATALMERSLIAREPLEGGVRLRLRRDSESEVRDLVRREQECCPFFRFSLRGEGSELVLDATAPAEARELLDELFAAR
jgi:MerR family transcriptional regulator, copper efflux regulator